MKNKLYIALWNWQTRHTAPRWISLNTGEVVSTLGRLMEGRYFDKANRLPFVWVSLRDYMAGKYDALMNGEAGSVVAYGLW